MPTTVRHRLDRAPVNSIDDVRTEQLRAGTVSQSRSIRLTSVVKNALQQHYGTLKGAALSMTPPMDPPQLTRELQTGDFKLEKLERLDQDGQAFVANAMHEALADADPKTQARRLIREARARLDELAEVIAS